MKSRDGKSQRREKNKKEDQKRESPRRKKIQVREKVGKSRNTVFFQWFVPPEGRKVGSLKRRVRSHLARWEIKSSTPLWWEAPFKSKCTKHTMLGPLLEVEMSKKCPPLWREAHSEVKSVKNWRVQSTLWSWDVESARRCGAKHLSKSKCTKYTMLGPLLEVEMSKKCPPLWREAHFEVKSVKNWRVQSTLGSWDVESARRCGAKHISKSKSTKHHMYAPLWTLKRCFAWQAQGTFEEDLQRCIFRGRRNTTDMFIRAVRRSGCWFPERRCILEHQIFSFGKMILRDRCSTLYDMVSLFRGKRNTLDTWSGKIAKRIGTRPSALHSTFHFWRKSRRIVSILMLSTSKIEEVSQNCFVFDAVKFKNWGSLVELSRFWHCQVQNWWSLADLFRFWRCQVQNWWSLADLFRFWRCQVQKLRKSRRIASFSSLQIDR